MCTVLSAWLVLQLIMFLWNTQPKAFRLIMFELYSLPRPASSSHFTDRICIIQPCAHWVCQNFTHCPRPSFWSRLNSLQRQSHTLTWFINEANLPKLMRGNMSEITSQHNYTLLIINHDSNVSHTLTIMHYVCACKCIVTTMIKQNHTHCFYKHTLNVTVNIWLVSIYWFWDQQ